MSSMHIANGNEEKDIMELSDSEAHLGRARYKGEIKPSELVLAAIHHLKEARGSTPKEIMDYISQEYNSNSGQLKKSVLTALKRGVQYGILRYENGHYMLEPIGDDDVVVVAKDSDCERITSLRRRGHGGCGHKRRRKVSRKKCGTRRHHRARKHSRSKCGSRHKRSHKRRSSRKRSGCAPRRKKSRCGKKRTHHRRKSSCGKRKKRSKCGGKKPRRCADDDDNDF